MQQREKVRVYILARELDIDTADLLRLCKQAGYDVKNQLSSLDHDQQIKLEEMVKKTAPSAAPVVSAKPVTKVVLPDEKPVPNLAVRPPKREPESQRPRPAPAPETPAVAEVTVEPEPPAPVQVQAPVETPTVAVQAPVAPPAPAPKPASPSVISSLMKEKSVPNLSGKAPAVKAPPASTPVVPVAPPSPAPVVPTPTVATAPPPAPPAAPPTAPAPAVKPEVPRTPTPVSPPSAPTVPGRVQHLSPTARMPQELGKRPSGPREPGTDKPGGGQTPRRTMGSPSHMQHLKPIAPPALRQQPKQAPPPPADKVLKPLMTFTKEQLNQSKPPRMEDLLKPPVEPVVIEPEGDDDEKGDKKKKATKKGAIPGRDDRQKLRNIRAEERKKQQSQVKIVGGKAELTTDEDQRGRTLHRIIKGKQKPLIKQRATYLELAPPFSIRLLSEELGIRSVELLFKLRDHGAPTNLTINSIIDAELAQLVALDFGCELKVLKPASDESVLLADFDPPDNPEDLVLRAPIVTVMGHVDHGKTSLLDRIRRSNVVATEAGGITQVIRAWRVDHGGRPVTFLDTPGHEAFTKMRARGAQVTDVAVIVVAADDGVMPQTEEAISHAKAAGVSLVVAINKVDMPSANVMRTRQQLYGLGVLPDNMGGDTPFVETSATTGKGIDELLDQLAIVAELKELKANPKRHAKGTCIEAMLSEDEGVRATLLIRDGTLRKGDVILCGASHGRVRQLYNDLGQPIQEAGPSVPVRITGLDIVPEAGDSFQVVPDLNVAAQIAETRSDKMRDTSTTKRPTLTLERLTETKIDELKVILKADFRGSIEAIRKELDKLQHAEVRVRILEAGIGAITENDVWLALASPEDTMIVGFNAVPDDRAIALAEERGLQIHEYNIIYNLTNDIRAALEGKLKPREEVVHLGRAVVRETFKISRVGTIAGCYVTQGNIKRNAKVRVIREGVVIFPPADRTAGLDSLKRFKEDTGEVREGFECGIKVAGYDDIKVGDVIEAYRVEHVQRTLD